MKRPDPFLLARNQGHVAAGQPYVPRGVQGIQLLAQWRQAQSGEHAWIARIVGTGMMKLRALHLSGQPAAEQLPITAELWCDVLRDLNLVEDFDVPRLETAFNRLLRTVTEWPQPADLIESMPRRDPVRRDPREVNIEPERTDRETASMREAIDEMQQMLRGERP